MFTVYGCNAIPLYSRGAFLYIPNQGICEPERVRPDSYKDLTKASLTYASEVLTKAQVADLSQTVSAGLLRESEEEVLQLNLQAEMSQFLLKGCTVFNGPCALAIKFVVSFLMRQSILLPMCQH